MAPMTMVQEVGNLRGQHIRGYFYNEMRYIDLRFTYLLTYRLGVGGCTVVFLGGTSYSLV